MVNLLQSQIEISTAIARCQQSSFLPKKELKSFDGSDPTSYKRFMINFNRIVENHCSDYGDKLLYLQQFTSGHAKKIVDSCVHYNATEGYLKAISLLNEEYGNEFKIANSYLKTLEDWPVLKSEDSDALSELSLFLLDCHHYLENMSMSNQMQNPKEIMSIVRKLPYKLQDRWRRRTNDIARNYQTVSFRHLVEFVQAESAVLKQPIFGQIGDTSSGTKSKTLSRDKNRKLLATQTENHPSTTTLSCEYCKKNNHNLIKCKFFEKIDHTDKCSFITRNKLCFSCLRKGHFSDKCTSKSTCTVCGKTHPKILHIYGRHVGNDSEERQQANSDAAGSSTSLSTRTPNSTTKKKIVPVIPVNIKLNNILNNKLKMKFSIFKGEILNTYNFFFFYNNLKKNKNIKNINNIFNFKYNLKKNISLFPEIFYLTNNDLLTYRLINNNKVKIKLGEFITCSEEIIINYSINQSGQILFLNKNKILLRRAKVLLLSSGCICNLKQGDFINNNSPLLTLTYKNLKTEDIVQGIPKIEQIFEARENLKDKFSLNSLIKLKFKNYKKIYSKKEAVHRSIIFIQQYIVDSVQKVYQSQGVNISDKHIEIIVKQMTSKVKITDPGNTGLLRGDIVYLDWIELINNGLKSKKSQYEPIILGISKACLEMDGFISAASFQETIKILSKAAILQKRDFLRGLKENLILGHLIPVGTGFEFIN